MHEPVESETAATAGITAVSRAEPSAAALMVTNPSAGAIGGTAQAMLDECLRAACAEALALYPHEGQLRVLGEACATLDGATAAPIGMIVKEAVINAIRHAHPSGIPGVVAVSAARDARGGLAIEIRDDGVGLPEGFDPARDGETGFRVMRALSERLGARLQFRSSPLGLTVRLRLPGQSAASRNPATAPANGRGGVIDAPANHSARRGAEDAMRRSERRLRQVLDRAVAFIGIMETDGTLIEANQPALAAGGLERHEAIGRKMWQTYWWSHDAAEAERLKQAVRRAAQGEAVRYDAVVRMKGDSRMEIDFLLSPVFDDDGAVQYLVPSGYDITERKRLAREATEQARSAADAHAKFRAFFDQGSFFAGLMTPDGTLLEANQLCLTACGFARDEVVGKKFWDCGWWNRSPTLMKLVRRATERAAAGETFRQETDYFVADGSVRRVDLIVTPVTDADGRVLFLAPTGSDITERHRIQAELRGAYDSFRYLVEQSPFGVYAVDADFRLAQVSAGAQKVFQNVRPLIGRDFADVLRTIWPEPFASEAIERFRHTLATGEPYHSADTTERRADVAETESYDWQLERIVLPDGRPGVVCHFYDLTERKRYEERVRLLMREVNHRAKNLLSVVQAVARQTARLGDPATFEERLSRRLAGLAASQDLLVQSQWRGVDMAELAHAQLRHLEELIGRRITIDGPPARLSASAAQAIGMALHELATNAVKYGALANDEGGVRLEWRIAEGDAEDGAGERRFEMHWLERDGPSAAPPTRSGFGQMVIGPMVEASLAGKVDIAYEASGLAWRLTAPADGALEPGARH